MSNNAVTHKQDKSELEKFKLFYEHVLDNRTATHTRIKRPRG
ncbi:MAG: hypothetical protein ACREGJ_00130 [Candidatus Saccharimonadales bacterium]